jgi:hypothetical protein
MDKDEHLQRHLDLCRRMYLRMLADGSWPWNGDAIEDQQSDNATKHDPTTQVVDSPKSENLIDSGDNPNVP